MPWTPADAQKHDKSANTPEKSKRWAKIANAVLKRTGDDAMAIKVANSRVEDTEPSSDHTLDESFFRRVMHHAFDTPPEFGGEQRAKKPKSAEGKPAVKEPFLSRVKKAATKAGEAIFPREDVLVRAPLVVEGEEKGKEKPLGAGFAEKVEKLGRKFEKAVDITHPEHKLHFIYKWAEGGAKKGGAKPAQPKRSYSPGQMGAGQAPSKSSGSAERAFVRTRFGTPMQQAARWKGGAGGAATPLPVRRPPGQSR